MATDDLPILIVSDDAPTAASATTAATRFREATGETLVRTLDVKTWSSGVDLGAVYARATEEVREAVARENVSLRRIREHVFPRIADAPDAPPGAGVYQMAAGDLERIHRDLLFAGRVEACDGTRQTHDTLPLTIHQIGVGLVSYRGDAGTYGQRLFQRDLRMENADPAEEVTQLLRRRAERGGLNQPEASGALPTLTQRGIMAHAERAVLLHHSRALWRMGHGNPAPYEIVTGSGYLELLIEGTRTVRELVEGHQRFVYVASEPGDRVLLTVGQALHPLEYAIVGTLRDEIFAVIEQGKYWSHIPDSIDTTWDGERLTPRDWIERFRDEVASQVVVGVYRASHLAPPQVFYAHVNHAHIAARIAIADSVLQEHRGFPMLIDLADRLCQATFGGAAFAGPIAAAYADADASWRFLSERATRR